MTKDEIMKHLLEADRWLMESARHDREKLEHYGRKLFAQADRSNERPAVEEAAEKAHERAADALRRAATRPDERKSALQLIREARDATDKANALL